MTQALFPQLSPRGIHIATLTVSKYVAPGSPDATAAADAFWALHSQEAGQWTWEAMFKYFGVHEAESDRRRKHGNQEDWNAGVHEGTGRMVHRNRPYRSSPYSARSGACFGRERDVRTGSTNSVAHASSRPDVDRHRRVRLGAARGRSD